MKKNRRKLIAISIFTVGWLFFDGVILNRPLTGVAMSAWVIDHRCVFFERIEMWNNGPIYDHAITVSITDGPSDSCGAAFRRAFAR
jgi:hypothetical protein